jgi:hypothetical protein
MRSKPKRRHPPRPAPAPERDGSPILADLRARVARGAEDAGMARWLLKLLESGERAAGGQEMPAH